MSLGLGAAVVAQPLAVAPSFPGFAFNEPRLSALGPLALVICLGAVLPDFLGPSARRPASLVSVALIAVLAVASLHHIYTVLGPPGPASFFLLQVVAAATAGALLIALHSRRTARAAAS